MSRIRCEVHDQHGEAVIYVDPDVVTVEAAALLDPIVAALSVVERGQLLTLLIRQIADDQAYARVAAERGVLAL